MLHTFEPWCECFTLCSVNKQHQKDVQSPFTIPYGSAACITPIGLSPSEKERILISNPSTLYAETDNMLIFVVKFVHNFNVRIS